MFDSYHPHDVAEEAIASLKQGLDLGTYLGVALELAHRNRNQSVAREIASRVADEPRQVFVRVRQMIYSMLAEPDLVFPPSARSIYASRLTDATRNLVIPETLDWSAKIGMTAGIYLEVPHEVYSEFMRFDVVQF